MLYCLTWTDASYIDALYKMVHYVAINAISVHAYRLHALDSVAVIHDILAAGLTMTAFSNIGVLRAEE